MRACVRAMGKRRCLDHPNDHLETCPEAPEDRGRAALFRDPNLSGDKMVMMASVVPPRIRMWSRAIRDWRNGEPELHILGKLCPPDQIALDIGANCGVYSWYLRRHARNVIAFEPQPDMADFLKAAFGSSVQVELVALSDTAGMAKMRIPCERYMGGCATIEEENTLSSYKVREISVPMRRLDGYDLGKVGFIKVDVEGHELKVLKGAEAVLRRDRPNLLIEAEDRHRPNAVTSVIDYLAPLGYNAYFLKDARLRPFSNSEAEKQSGLYNYIFSVRSDLH
ncbi:methyltransferase, FkbM family [Rhizobium sp. NFR07]|nr:methyltransferase, FkbM family [Rhizobium sp. NFR07]